MRWYIFFIFSIAFLSITSKVYAIVPPDFAIQIATQGGQIFVYIAITASVFLVVIWQYIKNFFFSKKSRFIIFILLLLGSFILVQYGGVYYKDYQIREKERMELEKWGRMVLSPLSIRQQKTYNKNKEAIDTFTKKLDKEIQVWMKNVIIVALDDLNSYLVQNNRSSISLSDIDMIDNSRLQEMLAWSKENRIILDVRDDYERKLIKLKGVKVIRFGNLVNNEFDGLPKDTEIIVLCYTDARSFVAANYLRSQGFSNVKAYKGGVMAWVKNKHPVEVNRQFQFIWNVLPYLSETQVKKVKKEQSAEELLFTSYSSSLDIINSLLMSDEQLDAFIHTLSPEKKYIIRCTDHHHCFDAVSFVDRAKSKKIQFIGYTGYVLP